MLFFCVCDYLCRYWGGYTFRDVFSSTVDPLNNMGWNYDGPLIPRFFFSKCILQNYRLQGSLNPWIWKGRYRGLSVKLRADFQLQGEFVSLTPVLFKSQLYSSRFSEKSVNFRVCLPFNIDRFKIKSQFRKKELSDILIILWSIEKKSVD